MQYNDTSRKIMKVALALFAENGYYQTTTKQIAQEAGVNELTLFRHFGSKNNLFQVTTQEYVIEAHVEKVLLEGIEDKTFEDSIIQIVEGIMKLYNQNKKLYKVQLKLSDQEGDFVKLKLSRRIKEVLIAWFKEMQDKKLVQGNPEIMATTLVNSLLGILTVEILSNHPFSSLTQSEQSKEIARLFIAGYKR